MLTVASRRKKKKLEEDLYWIVPHVHPTTQSVKGLNWTDCVSPPPALPPENTSKSLHVDFECFTEEGEYLQQ